jgi:hypothetical protein
MASPMKDVSVAKEVKNLVVLPTPNSDFYNLVETLPADKLAVEPWSTV